jgi:hypothetical protein
VQSIYHAGTSETQADGAKVWRTSRPFDVLAKVGNCRLENLEGNMRRTVYVTGEPDTYFSIPAVCKIQGCRVKGYVTGDGDGNLVFRHVYY